MSLKVIYKEEDNGFVGLSYEPFLQKTIMHLEFKKWSVQECKRYKQIWKIILKCLKDKGFTEIYSLCDSEKEAKFNRFFGFKDTGYLAQTDKGTKLLYKLEL